MAHNIDLITLAQEFIAVEAVGGNVLRNQERGVVADISKRLKFIQLKSIPLNTAQSYEKWLDSQTNEILDHLNVKVRPWGTVRKALNLFIRRCIWDYRLRSAYNLDKIERWTEIPLDSKVATKLKQLAGRGKLPAWPGLKRLTREENQQFQAFAAIYANENGFLSRADLDAHLWLENR